MAYVSQVTRFSAPFYLVKKGLTLSNTIIDYAKCYDFANIFGFPVSWVNLQSILFTKKIANLEITIES